MLGQMEGNRPQNLDAVGPVVRRQLTKMSKPEMGSPKHHLASQRCPLRIYIITNSSLNFLLFGFMIGALPWPVGTKMWTNGVTLAGSSWQPAAAHIALYGCHHNTTQPTFFFTNKKVFSVCTSFFRTIFVDSSRCHQEAVDKLFQQSLKCKIIDNLSLKLPFKSYHSLILDEITYISLKAEYPLIASRKQLTSCSSTPSGALLPS